MQILLSRYNVQQIIKASIILNKIFIRNWNFYNKAQRLSKELFFWRDYGDEDTKVQISGS